MNDDLSKRRLGRGLAALIGDIEKPAQAQADQPRIAPDRMIPIEFLSPNPRNPRRSFDESELAELAQSIREHGIVQPVVARQALQSGRFEIIAGERRWRAAQRAGLIEVPVVLREVDDRVALELAIVENVQRSDLNPVEEALGYQQLIDEHNYSQADLAQIIGKSRSHVANTLRLLKLPQHIRDMVVDGSLSAGHARTLVTAHDAEALARRIIEGGLSVRQAEALAHQPAEAHAAPVKAGKAATEKDPDTLALEKRLSDACGMKVTISHGDKGGEIRIAYRTLDQLDELSRRLAS